MGVWTEWTVTVMLGAIPSEMVEGNIMSAGTSALIKRDKSGVVTGAGAARDG